MASTCGLHPPTDVIADTVAPIEQKPQVVSHSAAFAHVGQKRVLQCGRKSLQYCKTSARRVQLLAQVAFVVVVIVFVVAATDVAVMTPSVRVAILQKPQEVSQFPPCGHVGQNSVSQ